MKIATIANDTNSLRTHVVQGDLNLPDLTTFLTELYAAQGFHSEYNALWDVRAAEFAQVTQPDILALANFVRVNWAEKRKLRAAIVVSSAFHFGISRAYEQLIGPSGYGKTRIFRDFEEAKSWVTKPDTVAPHEST